MSFRYSLSPPPHRPSEEGHSKTGWARIPLSWTTQNMPSSSSTRVKPEPVEDETLRTPRSPLSKHPAQPLSISFSPYPPPSSEEPQILKSLLTHATDLLHTELSSSKAECAKLREENEELRKRCTRMRYERDVVRWRVGLLSGRIVPASTASVAMGDVDGALGRMKRRRRVEDDQEERPVKRRLDRLAVKSLPIPVPQRSTSVQDEDAASDSDEETEVDEFTLSHPGRRRTPDTLYSSSTAVEARWPSVNDDTPVKLECPEADLWSDGSGSQDMDLESQSD